MMIARWSIDAKFGYKTDALDLMLRWAKEVGPQIGWTQDKMRIITGSIGTRESTIQSEIMIKDLTELNQSWEKLGAIAAHQEWSKKLEQFVVSGTNRWEIYRLVE